MKSQYRSEKERFLHHFRERFQDETKEVVGSFLNELNRDKDRSLNDLQVEFTGRKERHIEETRNGARQDVEARACELTAMLKKDLEVSVASERDRWERDKVASLEAIREAHEVDKRRLVLQTRQMCEEEKKKDLDGLAGEYQRDKQEALESERRRLQVRATLPTLYIRRLFKASVGESYTAHITC